MIPVLVTGGNGQLGRELRDLADSSPGFRFLFTDVEELDITRPQLISKFFLREKPGIVINCAAFTAVDRAEDEPEAAYLLNASAPGFLAEACSASGAFLIHLSTDYIFPGTTPDPLTETDPPGPVSVYGKTKLEGERLVTAKTGHAAILRTSWLYSSYGHNFVKTILRLGRERDSLRVVNDQTGSPTYARDLARALISVASHRNEIQGTETFHYANAGATTWFEFARTLLAMKEVSCEVHPIRTDEYPTRAVRPRYSILSSEKITSRFGILIPGWKESLKACLQKTA